MASQICKCGTNDCCYLRERLNNSQVMCGKVGEKAEQVDGVHENAMSCPTRRRYNKDLIEEARKCRKAA